MDSPALDGFLERWKSKLYCAAFLRGLELGSVGDRPLGTCKISVGVRTEEHDLIDGAHAPSAISVLAGVASSLGGIHWDAENSTFLNVARIEAGVGFGWFASEGVMEIEVFVVAVGLMPWLHRKYSFLSIGLLWLVAERHWTWLRQQRVGVRATAAALGLVPHAAFHMWTLREWGHLGGGFMTTELPFSFAGFRIGALGLFLDRERGLLGYAPIFLIVPACCAFTWRATWRMLAATLLLVLPMAAYLDWGAGFSPPARYIVQECD